jgi:hypothetical protein
MKAVPAAFQSVPVRCFGRRFCFATGRFYLLFDPGITAKYGNIAAATPLASAVIRLQPLNSAKLFGEIL